MSSLLQKRLSKAGLAKQTAKGTAAGAATYGYGVDGGSIFKLELEESEIPLTWSNLDVLGFDRKGVKPMQDTGTVATPNLIGLLLLGALGADAASAGISTTLSAAAVAGASSVSTPVSIPSGSALTIGTGPTIETHTTGAPTGAGPYTIPLITPLVNAQASGVAATTPNSHVLTPASTLPYLTAFGSFGTADWASIVDTKVSSLELSWDQAGRVSVKQTLAGITPAFLAAAYTETNNEVLSQVGFFTAGGGVFNVEGAGAAVAGGNIKIDNHLAQPIVAANVGPADVVEGKREITWSLKILPYDTKLFREVYFGSGGLGALAGLTPFPRLGAISAQFTGPNATSLSLASTAVRFMVDFPESSPEGGPAELTLAGTSVLPATGPSVTATLLNGVASY